MSFKSNKCHRMAHTVAHFSGYRKKALKITGRQWNCFFFSFRTIKSSFHCERNYFLQWWCVVVVTKLFTQTYAKIHLILKAGFVPIPGIDDIDLTKYVPLIYGLTIISKRFALFAIPFCHKHWRLNHIQIDLTTIWSVFATGKIRGSILFAAQKKKIKTRMEPADPIMIRSPMSQIANWECYIDIWGFSIPLDSRNGISSTPFSIRLQIYVYYLIKNSTLAYLSNRKVHHFEPIMNEMAWCSMAWHGKYLAVDVTVLVFQSFRICESATITL